MKIKRTTEKEISGSFTAKVKVENVKMDVIGTFEVPDPGSDASLALAVELAIKEQIEIEIISIKRDAMPADA